MTSGAAWEDTCRPAGSGTMDIISFLVTSAGNRSFFRGSLQQIPPEPRAFTNLVSLRDEMRICELKNQLLGSEPWWRWLVLPWGGSTAEGSILVYRGEWLSPPKSVEVFSLQRVEHIPWSFMYENLWFLHCCLDGNLILQQLFEMYHSSSSNTRSPFFSACHFSLFQIKKLLW